ncbi:MAG: phenylalanine--tRNA ligase subunit beta, partial [Ruthenibacterium sp.]
MIMPLKWAKEFAKFECTPHEYAERMTMSGSKVETFSCEADAIQNVVVGKILSIVPHPDSDHMVICQVEVGQSAPVQIVTGAANLKVGDLVPAALHVAKLPGGVEIRKGKLRGVESCGMLCSLTELCLTTHDFPNAIENGILVLDEVWPAGTDITVALGMDDVSVDFEITPNRPDCLAVRGLARESAATFGVPFEDHAPEVKPGHGSVSDLLRVDIENSDLCYRYCGAVVENVRVKPSPRWLRERLRLCGVRPINNLVDITNYVMLEYGQPMHCFDYQYVNGGHIVVRNATQGESIVTLDDATRALSEEMLVISDDKGPIAVAGVMGGEYSGVYKDTTTIVFESAMFNGPSVRTTAKKLGLRTEASGRYEKGLDPNGCARSLARALEL